MNLNFCLFKRSVRICRWVVTCNTYFVAHLLTFHLKSCVVKLITLKLTYGLLVVFYMSYAASQKPLDKTLKKL